MRTKLLLCAAALAVSALTSMAQVYSLNIVGYYQVTCVPGYTVLANQLQASPDNTVASVLGNAGVADNDSLLFWDNASGFSENIYYGGGAWDDPARDFSPGVAAFYKNAGGANYTLTFVGQVPTGTLSQTLNPGYSLVCSKVPQAGDIDVDLGLNNAQAGDSILFYDGGYAECPYYGGGAWDFPPIIDVGKGFFYKNAGSSITWTRTFNP